MLNDLKEYTILGFVILFSIPGTMVSTIPYGLHSNIYVVEILSSTYSPLCISPIYSRNSEAYASEFLENLEEIYDEYW